MTKIAITREVSATINNCELTHVDQQAIDVSAARSQHDSYEHALRQLGFTVIQLPAADDYPDAVFVEDAAVVFPELAVITRPGAESRRGETESIANALSPYRTLQRIDGAGTLDGGDVMVVGKRVFVGDSSRSNASGVSQLRATLAPHGYTVTAVKVPGCLHLKSGVTPISDRTLVINRAWVDAGAFGGFKLIDVHPDEPSAACVLAIGDTVLCSAESPLTASRIAKHCAEVQLIENSELAKAEGGLTCCSLIIDT